MNLYKSLTCHLNLKGKVCVVVFFSIACIDCFLGPYLLVVIDDLSPESNFPVKYAYGNKLRFSRYFWIALFLCLRIQGSVGNVIDEMDHHLLPHKAKHNVIRPKNELLTTRNNYREFRHPKDNGPVVVEFSAYVVDINSINVEDMDFRVDIFVRQQWIDTRINITTIFEDDDEFISRPPEYFDHLWQPDPYILNSKVSEIAVLSQKLSSVTLFRNQTVRFVARMHAIVACQMEFQLYPMDIQLCPMYIESFSYNNEKMRLKWGEDGVTVNSELKLLQYYMDHNLKLEETDGTTFKKSGNYSRLIIYFRFERQIGHHLIQTFAPSTLVVVLSWFSFWFELDAIPGRVTLLVTSMLTLVTMFRGLKSDIPPVAYVKALDLWMAGCMVFVFAALAEFVIVKVLHVRYQNEMKKNKADPPRIFPLISAYPTVKKGRITAWEQIGAGDVKCRKIGAGKTVIKLSWLDESTGSKKILHKEIDRLSRTIFPILFLCFVSIYWPILLLKKASM